ESQWNSNMSLVDNLTACGEENTFTWPDYAVLAAMLIITASIGLFYGFFGPKQKTASDFLLGGSNMGTFPMAMSLASSFITAIELLGNPAEMYIHGTQFWMTCVSFIIVIPITAYFYLPVYCKLKLTSAYEYLEMRFSQPVRIIAAGLYVLQMVLYTSVAVYAPALALNHVTGLNVYIAVSCIYVVCIFYASQGGMKAVIMTDTFQAMVLITSILLILGLGDSYVGGPSFIWEKSSSTERLEFFNMDPNPTVRHSFWSVVIGGSFYWLAMFCSNQASIQKYLSVETISQCRVALWVSCGGLILIFTINFYTGMIIYAQYHDCDPLQTNRITQSDQLLPLYIMSEIGHLRGVPGYFVAGIFAASLGTVASALNSLTAITVKDFINGAFKVQLPEEKGAMIGKWISFAFGLLSFGLVFVVAQLGSVLQVALSFNGMVGGVTLGLFTLGMFFPWANSKGALIGVLTATVLVLWIGFGTQAELASGTLVFEEKITSIEGCQCVNLTDIQHTVIEPAPAGDAVFLLYRLSYLWYTMIGCLVTVIVGLIGSFVTGSFETCHLNPDLTSPPITWVLQNLPESVKEVLRVLPDAKESESLKKQTHKSTYNSMDIGVINLGLCIEDEKPKFSQVSKVGTINNSLKY
ncbi:hypothetical protein L9F63_023934, partial [Diploptera punctata]